VPRRLRGRTTRRRVPALPEGPFLRRVRLRLGLGRCLPAPRAGLLPQAARRRALHARSGGAVAGARRSMAPRAAARDRDARAPGAPVLRSPALPRRGGPARGARGRLDDARIGAVTT